MKIHAGRTLGKKSQAVSNGQVQKQSAGEPYIQFTDNRPEPVLQRKLKKIASTSLRSKRVEQLQSRVEYHPSKQFQKQGLEEDEPLQGKFCLIQKQESEEEELLQGKFEPLFKTGGKLLSEISNVQSELINSVNDYLTGKKGVKDPQGIALPGMSKALKAVKVAKAEVGKSKNDLAVKAGLDGAGNLVMVISGILPGPKKYEVEVILRKKFDDVIKQLGSEKSIVVHMAKGGEESKKIWAQLVTRHGRDIDAIKKDRLFKFYRLHKASEDIITRAVARQGKKFNTTGVSKDEADFGSVTTGTVILAAHGQPVEEKGRIIGKKLGKKTAEEIVALLTENAASKKNLSRSFNGTVLLSGCYTAAGGITPPGESYDYDTFAGKVWRLLKAKGIKSCRVQGMPGIARTLPTGDKASVKPTEQKEYDRLKKEKKVLQEKIKSLASVLNNLEKKHGGNKKALANDSGIGLVKEEIGKLTNLAAQVESEKESKVMERLIGTYGLGAVR